MQIFHGEEIICAVSNSGSNGTVTRAKKLDCFLKRFDGPLGTIKFPVARLGLSKVLSSNDGVTAGHLTIESASVVVSSPVAVCAYLN